MSKAAASALCPRAHAQTGTSGEGLLLPAVALGMKGTNWYTINGFCLTAVFTLCRIVWTAYLDFFFFRCAFLALRGEMDPGPPGKGFVVFAMFACTFLTGLNVFWWSKMVAYVVKVSHAVASGFQDASLSRNPLMSIWIDCRRWFRAKRGKAKGNSVQSCGLGISRPP